MKISSVMVRNFRCLKDATLPCESLTALIGPNGSGKSSFLRALDLFYRTDTGYEEEDFHGGNTNDPITIAVTFEGLSDSERRLFGSHLGSDTLTIEKELIWPPGKTNQRYFGSALRFADFAGVRAGRLVPDKRTAYQDLVNSGQYADLTKLPGNASGPQLEAALKEWETAHPERLQRMRDDGQFFGFKEVGRAHLERYTRFVYIPAVREASEDATEGKGKMLSELMDLVVRSALAQRGEVRKLREETQRSYDEIMDPSRLEELQELEAQMSGTLNNFAPGAGVQLKWLPRVPIDIPMPTAEVKVVEDDYASAIERAGHGVQRAFILTVLQHLALAQIEGAPSDESVADAVAADADLADAPEHAAAALALPTLVLGIEEPELYQHPSRQRHLAQVLLDLASGGIKGVAPETQVIYSTHSPLFVDLPRFGHLRVLRKRSRTPGSPKDSGVTWATIDAVTREIERADDAAPGSYTAEAEIARLRTLMTPWTNEGFFSAVAVLVEGEEDRGAILGTAGALRENLERKDIAVIPCMGKPNLHKAAAIFRSLGIRIYVIWDSDEGKNGAKPEDNHRLLRFLGADVEDFPERIADDHACVRRNLQATLQAELTAAVFDKIEPECRERLGYSQRKDALKSPLAVEQILEEAAKQGHSSVTLENIVRKILELATADSADVELVDAENSKSNERG